MIRRMIENLMKNGITSFANLITVLLFNMTIGNDK